MTKLDEILENMAAGKINGGTLARLLALLASILNLIIAETAGAGKAYTVLSIALAAVSALAAYWKNNSFTDAALAADEVLGQLRGGR